MLPTPMDVLNEIGPLYGYYPNGSKTHMHVLVKSQHSEAANEIFEGTGISISTEGECYLSRAMGTASFL